MTTHASYWQSNPKGTGIFVNPFAGQAIEVLKKNKTVKKVLDVACGNGIGETLPLLRAGYEVTAFDHLKSAVTACRQNAKDEGLRARIHQGNMYSKYPYQNRNFDAVFCFQAIYHGRLEQINTALSEISRVTKKSGYFFSTFPQYEQIHEKYGMYFENVRLTNGKVIQAGRKPDKNEPHLLYYLTKEFEYMVPHYYFQKKELENTLNRYFSKVDVSEVKRNHGYARFWYAACRK